MMLNTDTFQYPVVNVPPIVYQNEAKGETNNSSTTTATTTQNTNTNTNVSITGQSGSAVYTEDPSVRVIPLSFIQTSSTENLVPMEGYVSHSRSHVLTNTEFVSPTKPQPVAPPSAAPSQEDFHEMEQAKKGYMPITRADEEAMKFYVAGMGVVSLIILYKMLY